MDIECLFNEHSNSRGSRLVLKLLLSNPKYTKSHKKYSSGLWRHPRNKTTQYKNISYWIELAKILDGNFHGLFLADMLGIYDVYKGPGNIREVLPGAAQFPISDPS
jgi:hypothetical protein